MGKVRNKGKYGLKLKAQSRRGPPGMEDSDTGVDELLNLADSSMNELQFEAAKEFCERVLQLEPDNIKALETLSTILLEIGDPTSAMEVLQKMISLQPDTGFRKYLSMAQLSGGKDALRCYSKGAAIIEQQIHEKENCVSETVSENIDLNRELSSVYCAMAEVYMTDCCFDEDAEEKCSTLIEKGISADPSNPEALQCKVNFLLVKGQNEEAKGLMERSLSLWLPRYQSIRENKTASEDVDPVEVCSLSYSSRVDASKLLIELEMYDEAGDILDGLVEEDDEVVDVWYLLGWLNYLRGEDYRGNARFYLNRAKEVAAKVQFDDEDEIRHIGELLAEIGDDDDDDDEENDVEDEEKFESESEEEEEPGAENKMEH
ncbi:uncharacterized protein LOC135366521 [Ornithodoros turicata]|uniref:uncharacterized protein LOC135366521 n=1 Tax=Ornithodoros turicata TaxID=34597 RepID=UPI00313A216E